MRLWVTGSRGFVGRHVVDQAARAGHEVWALVRASAAASADVPTGAHLLPLDIDNRASVVAAVERDKPDAIIHLAWYARPQDYLTSFENVDSLGTTLRFARSVLLGGCRKMVGVGTCLEYADKAGPRCEDDLLDPKSLYARCKRSAHLVLTELFQRQSATLVWARLFHMHGPGEHPARLIPALAAALRAGRPFALSPGEQVRDHLDVRDVASALVHLASSEVEGAVNVCSGKPVTLRMVLETVGRELGHPELLQFGQRAYLPGEVMNLCGASDRLAATGWRPAHADLAASLRETIAAGGATL